MATEGHGWPMSEHTTPDGSRRIDGEPADRLPAHVHGRLREATASAGGGT